MAAVMPTPRRSQTRRPGRPRVRSDRAGSSEPPLKKLRYIPGGPGGGGRYVDEDGNETVNFTGSRTRSSRPDSEQTPAAHSPTATYTRPRRDRPEPTPRFSSAAAAATAMSQSEGYKPREERGWEEFHPDLDLDADLMIFSADEVDGRYSGGATPRPGYFMSNKSVNESGMAAAVDEALMSQQATPTLAHGLSQDVENGDMLNFISPLKRRVGRPPRRPESMLNGLGSPPAPRIVPLPTHNPKERLNLPKPNFRRVEIFEAFEHDKSVGQNYVDKSLSNVGYQESDRFIRPDKTYLRCGEGSLEDDLDILSTLQHGGEDAAFGRVEYDMDEQDERWLEGINAERRQEGVESIRPAILEITITAIEKQWYALEKRIPKPNPKPPQTHRPRSGSSAAVNGEAAAAGEEQDTKCAVCDDGDCENTNAIVFCDGCDLAVHQECYGVPFIPEGQWLCRKCQLIGRNTPTCIFCPNVDGAFKQTNTLRWSHLLCAIWIPEVSLGNTTFMEPVMDVEKVPRQRWKLTCYICQQRMGACVQCSNKNCFIAFHVTCARRAHLFLKMKSPHGSVTETSYLKAFCDKHVPPDWRREHGVELATAEAKDFYRRTMRGRRWADSQQSALAPPGPQALGYVEEDVEQEDTLATVSGNKRKRQEMQKSIWRLPSGAPIIPQAVYHNVEKALTRFNIRKRKDFVAEACKYWSLKREARRGASLLKRLQLQMETFTSMEMTRRNFAGMGAIGRPRLQRRIEFAERLEDDMGAVHVLCEKIKEQQHLKLSDLDILHSLVDLIYFPILPLLSTALEKAQTLDANVRNYFKQGLDTVQNKLETRAILSVTDFSMELAKAFSNWQPVESAMMPGDESMLPKTLSHEQRERRNRAKRIIDEIKKQFLREATRKEADITGKNYEDEWDKIEKILDEPFHQPLSSTQTVSNSNKIANGQEDTNLHTDLLRDLSNGYTAEPIKASPIVNVDEAIGGDVEVTEDPDGQLTNSVENGEASTPTKSVHTFQDGPNGDATTTNLQLSKGVTESSSNPDSKPPFLSVSDSGHELVSNADVVTPTTDEKSMNAPIGAGGVPFYLEDFEPNGTTVWEPPWKGRDVLMSEELSELDDDALNNLVDDEIPEIPNTENDEDENQMLKVQATLKKKSAKRRRRPW